MGIVQVAMPFEKEFLDVPAIKTFKSKITKRQSRSRTVKTIFSTLTAEKLAKLENGECADGLIDFEVPTEAKIKKIYPEYEALEGGDKVTVVKTHKNGVVTIEIDQAGGEKLSPPEEIDVAAEDWKECFQPLTVTCKLRERAPSRSGGKRLPRVSEHGTPSK